jgi:hypothetical protein
MEPKPAYTFNHQAALLVAFERLHQHDETLARQMLNIMADLAALAEDIALYPDDESVRFQYSRAQGMVDALVLAVS